MLLLYLCLLGSLSGEGAKMWMIDVEGGIFTLGAEIALLRM